MKGFITFDRDIVVHLAMNTANLILFIYEAPR